MEKIQSAIAKARVVRGEQTSERGQPLQKSNALKVSKEAQSAPDVDAAWNALPMMNLDLQLLKRNRIVSAEVGGQAQEIDMMRTRVLQQMRDNKWRRLAITSPTSACGKTSIALNLGLSLQRQPSLRTILMEVDLRRPSLGKISGIDREINFAEVLDGTRSFDQNAVRYADNFAISTVSHSQRNSAELLSGPNVPAALEMIEKNYAPDLMIFDTPPMLMTDDMMAFARHVDCVLLVAGAEATTIREIDLCERELASQTNVMGVVLNKCRYMGSDYGYGYYG